MPITSSRYESSITVTAPVRTTAVVTTSLSGNMLPIVITDALSRCAIALDMAKADARADNLGCMLIILVCGDSFTGDSYE